MCPGYAAAVTGILLLVAFSEEHGLESKFLRASAGVYWFKKSASPEVFLFTTRILQPFPNVFAMAASGGLLASIIIGVGFLANAFQIACNSYIGVSKILVKMSQDGILPRWLRLDEIDPRHRSPARAYRAYLILGLPFIAAYSLLPQWADYTLGVTFACGYVFMLTAFAATRIPTGKFRMEGSESDVERLPGWVFKVVGYTGGAFAALMVGAYMVIPQLGLQGVVPFSVGFAIVLICVAITFASRLSLRRGAPEEPPKNHDTGIVVS